MAHDFYIAFEHNGHFHFAIPVPQFEGTKEELIQKTVPPGVEWHEILPNEVPEDWTFFDAWEIKDKKISHNMEKCKHIHIENLRSIRDEKLADLDKEFMKALEANDEAKKAQIIIQKKVLRDMPSDPIFHTASNPDELKQIIPDYLR